MPLANQRLSASDFARGNGKARAKRFTGAHSMRKKMIREEAAREPIVLHLRVPPSTNRNWKYGRGRVYRSKESNAYHEHVAAVGLESRAVPFNGPVRVIVRIYNSRLDCDAVTKVLFDALQGVAYENDRQIKGYSVDHDEWDREPGVMVWVISTERRQV